jgi:predicted dehydrogenase
MSSAPLRLAFAGANATRGWAKDAHLTAVRAIPDIEVYALSARTQELAEAAADVFGAHKAYGDSLEMVCDPAIDIVAVTVKVPEHRAIVLAALDAGKHVYCEWPLGRDIAEAEEMAAAARHAKGRTAIGTQGVLAPAVRHAAQLVHDGAIGKPLNLRVVSPTAGWADEAPAFYAYLQDKRNGATLSTIAGGHTLAAIEAVIGRYVDVAAQNSILRRDVRISGTDDVIERTCPDHILAIGHHDSGCVSSLEVFGGTPDAPFRFELRGTKGKLEIVGGHAGGFQTGHLTVSTLPETGAQPDVAVPGLKGPPINVSEMWTTFVSDIRNGTHVMPGFDDAVRLTRLLDAIDTASDEGRRVSL